MTYLRYLLAFLPFLLTSSPALASAGGIMASAPHAPMIGMTILAFFAIAYSFVIVEEKTHLRKSKSVTLTAGFIWALVVFAYSQHGRTDDAITLLRHSLLEYAELMLFLLAAMTYVNSMQERNVFDALRVKLINKGLSLRTLFWVCGIIAFFLSPIADNLTTSLILGAVCVAVGKGHNKFIATSLINIVIAANAGGAFSPFGDITTLMVWQKGLVDFFNFFYLFFPSLISWLIPAVIMSLTIPKTKPKMDKEVTRVKFGGKVICFLFAGTIALTVTLHQTLHIPPFLGMMTGLGFLKIYGYFIRRYELRHKTFETEHKDSYPFDIFRSLVRIEWDTLLFFYGVMMCVGGIGAMNYLHTAAEVLYGNLGDTYTHILVGFLSAIVDNIPVMFAVLSMDQTHNLGQWLLVTLTAGIGGSMLSIGSAAGVALMGQARGVYTFFSHLKWTWAIAIGYIAGIAAHMVINADKF